MGRLVPLETIMGDTVFVADIKLNFIKELVRSASRVPSIEKIILFGSCIREDCRESSDIDFAVYVQDKDAWLISDDVKCFTHPLYAYDIDQEFDMVVRGTGEDCSSSLQKSISRGILLYVKR